MVRDTPLVLEQKLLWKTESQREFIWYRFFQLTVFWSRVWNFFTRWPDTNNIHCSNCKPVPRETGEVFYLYSGLIISCSELVWLAWSSSIVHIISENDSILFLEKGRAPRDLYRRRWKRPGLDVLRGAWRFWDQIKVSNEWDHISVYISQNSKYTYLINIQLCWIW